MGEVNRDERRLVSDARAFLDAVNGVVTEDDADLRAIQSAESALVGSLHAALTDPKLLDLCAAVQDHLDAWHAPMTGVAEPQTDATESALRETLDRVEL